MKRPNSHFRLISVSCAALCAACGQDSGRSGPAPDSQEPDGARSTTDSVLPKRPLLPPLPAQERGNGGKGVVCKDSQGAISSVRTLDLYEAETVYGMTFADVDETDEWKIVENVLGYYMRYSPMPWAWIRSRAERIRKSITFVPSGNFLLPTNDAVETALPEGCGLSQIATYVDGATLAVDTVLWNKLAPREKAALLLHEAIYEEEREGRGAKDSRFARKVTGALLSKESQLIPPGQGFGGAEMRCSGYADRGQVIDLRVHDTGERVVMELRRARGVIYSQETTTHLADSIDALWGDERLLTMMSRTVTQFTSGHDVWLHFGAAVPGQPRRRDVSISVYRDGKAIVDDMPLHCD